VFFYGCAVALIIATVYFAIHWAVRTFLAARRPAAPLWDPMLLRGSAGHAGGRRHRSAVQDRPARARRAVVAQMLGGRPVAPDTTDPASAGC
jgi:hypothetical protein